MKLENVVFNDYSGQRIKKASPVEIDEYSEIKQGEKLYLSKSQTQIEIGKSIGGGGEGKIFETSIPGYVAKIYPSKEKGKCKRTVQQEEKLKRMVNYENTNKHICWPTDLIYKNNKFVGFLMPYVNGKSIKDIYDHQDEWEKIGVKKEDQISMVLEILETFKWLHQRNILVGDINIDNILFDEKSLSIYFIDMDSVQFEEFPCKVTTEGYDAPEVIGKDGKEGVCAKNCNGDFKTNIFYSKFYRTKSIETFSMATLVYYFLMGTLPYDISDYDKDGCVGDEKRNRILKYEKRFPYSLSADEYANGEKVENYKNDMRFSHATWSHLPSFIKTLFVETFYQNKRYNDDSFIVFFKRYKEYLAKKDLKDKEANKLYPDTVIEYEKTKYDFEKALEKKGFNLESIISKIYEEANQGKQINKETTSKVASALKQSKSCNVGRCKFNLVYDIGVLKKVKCIYSVL